MDTRYQVFVSSTYTDLVEERRAVMHCLLEMGSIPAGMELFPAADESVWGLVESVIKQSDYYILIVGGRYGSKSKDNPLAYTHREFRLAVKLKVPVLAFLHGNLGAIPVGKADLKDEDRQALDAFREEVANGLDGAAPGRVIKRWTNPDDLASKVILAMNHAIKANPRIGWMRADQRADPRTLRDLESLRREVEVLRAKVANAEAEPVATRTDLAWGDAQIPAKYIRKLYGPDPFPSSKHSSRPLKSETVQSLGMTWHEAFRLLGPVVRTGGSEYDFRFPLEEAIKMRELNAETPSRGDSVDISVNNEAVHLIQNQFSALRLWEFKVSDTKRGDNYWWLTERGKAVLEELLAVKSAQQIKPKPKATKSRPKPPRPADS